MVFNFTKRPEIDVEKTTGSGKSHGMRAVYETFESKAIESAERKLQLCFKKRLQTKDVQPWS